MTTTEKKEFYENWLEEAELVESSLYSSSLTEHLNVEVALGRVTTRAAAAAWLASTFFAVRFRRNPRHYGCAYGYKSEKILACEMNREFRRIHWMTHYITFSPSMYC